METFIAIIVLGIIIVFIYNLNIKKYKAYKKGKKGESLVSKKLLTIPNSILLNNIVFSVSNHKTCQIDHILVSTRGIFVVETKNYSGKIYGDDIRLKWIQVFQFGKFKNKFYSPVKQNITHVYELSKKITCKKIFNCVVFVDGDISQVSSNYAFNLNEISNYILSHKEVITMAEVEEIANDIFYLNEKISNKNHVKNIKCMKDNIDNNICPRCNNDLILKTSKNGNFYGCVRYPKCKFTKKS